MKLGPLLNFASFHCPFAFHIAEPVARRVEVANFELLIGLAEIFATWSKQQLLKCYFCDYVLIIFDSVDTSV